MDNVLDIVDMINGSMCKDCIQRVSRVISMEGLDLLDEDGEVLDIDTEDEYEFIHESCSLLHIELDHIVLNCSAYKSKYNSSEYFFTNKDILG